MAKSAVEVKDDDEEEPGEKMSAEMQSRMRRSEGRLRDLERDMQEMQRRIVELETRPGPSRNRDEVELELELERRYSRRLELTLRGIYEDNEEDEE